MDLYISSSHLSCEQVVEQSAETPPVGNHGGREDTRDLGRCVELTLSLRAQLRLNPRHTTEVGEPQRTAANQHVGRVQIP